MIDDINTKRTELANQFAAAGAALLDFTGTAAALAAIPDTDPQQYAAAGTPEDIAKILPATITPQRRQKHGERPSADSLEWEEGDTAATSGDAPADDQWMFDLAAEYESRGNGLYGPFTFSAEQLPAFVRAVAARIERAAAPAPSDDVLGPQVWSKQAEMLESWKAPATASGDELPPLPAPLEFIRPELDYYDENQMRAYARAALSAAKVPAAGVLQGWRKALHAAVAAIYFDDSSDYRSALGSVVRYLDADLAGELLSSPKAAYDKACAMLAAAPVPPVAAQQQVPTVTLSGHQMREALGFINPDGDADLDQLDDELTFGIVQHQDDNGCVATGMCCWNSDTDGVLPLDRECTPPVAAPDCGACPGGGSICKAACKLAEDSPPVAAQPVAPVEVPARIVCPSCKGQWGGVGIDGVEVDCSKCEDGMIPNPDATPSPQIAEVADRSALLDADRRAAIAAAVRKAYPADLAGDGFVAQLIWNTEQACMAIAASRCAAGGDVVSKALIAARAYIEPDLTCDLNDIAEERRVRAAAKAVIDIIDAAATAPKSAGQAGQVAMSAEELARALFQQFTPNGMSPTDWEMNGVVGMYDKIGQQFREGAKAIMELLAAQQSAQLETAAPGDWISVDERLPSKYCLAVYETSRGQQRIIRAMHVNKYEIEATGDDCHSEINDENDTEYLREGWYELIDNWGEYSSVNVCEGVVTHWMPLPDTPDAIRALRSQASNSQEGGAA